MKDKKVQLIKHDSLKYNTVCICKKDWGKAVHYLTKASVEKLVDRINQIAEIINNEKK